MIKVKVFSDCHGYLPNITEEFDLLLIAGDITPCAWGYGSKIVQLDWIYNEFKEWLDNLPYRTSMSKVYLVPGNHDRVFDGITENERKILKETLGNKFELLLHEEKTFTNISEDGNLKEIRIFGTPFCKKFGNWSFMYDDEILTDLYNEIPEGLDILITHDPPTLNNLGMISEGRQKGVNAGNSILAERVLKIKPKYLFSGHIHSGNHSFEEYEGILMANVAHVNEQYYPVFKVLSFEL